MTRTIVLTVDEMEALGRLMALKGAKGPEKQRQAEAGNRSLIARGLLRVGDDRHLEVPSAIQAIARLVHSPDVLALFARRLSPEEGLLAGVYAAQSGETVIARTAYPGVTIYETVDPAHVADAVTGLLPQQHPTSTESVGAAATLRIKPEGPDRLEFPAEWNAPQVSSLAVTGSDHQASVAWAIEGGNVWLLSEGEQQAPTRHLSAQCVPWTAVEQRVSELAKMAQLQIAATDD